MAETSALPGPLSIIDAFNTAAGQMAGFAGEASGLTAQGVAGLKKGQAATQAEAEAQVIIQNEEAKKINKINSDQAKVSADFGTNPDAASYVLAKMAQDVLDTDKQLDEKYKDLGQKRQAISEKLNTGILPDPVSYLMAQLSVGGDIQQYNLGVNDYSATEERKNAKIATIGQLEEISSKEFALISQINRGINEKELQAKNTVTLQAAQKEVAKSEAAIAQLGLQGLSVRIHLNSQQFSNVVQLNSSLVQLENLKLNKDAAVRAEESHTLDMQVKKWMLEDKQGEKAAEDALEQNLSRVLRTLGAAPMSYKQLKAMPSGKTKDELLRLMTDPNLQEGRLSFNTAEAVNVANDLRLPLTPAANTVREQVTSEIAALSHDVEYQGLKPAEKLIRQQEVIKARLQKEMKNIPDAGGVFSPAPLSGVVNIDSLQDNALVQALKPLAVNNKTYATKADDIITMATNMISDSMAKGGDVQVAVAAMAKNVTDMYKAIQIDNNQQRMYQRFAIPQLDEKTGFKQTVYSQMGYFRSANQVDMTNTSAVENMLLRALNGRTIATEGGAFDIGNTDLSKRPAMGVKK